MSRRTILRFARPMTMQAILQGIVSRTNEHQGPHRPQVTTVKPVVAESYQLPVFMDAPPEDGAFGLVYSEGCCPDHSPYDPLLIVCLRPLPGHGTEQDGLFSDAIVVYVWQEDAYPLSPPEVQWSIAHDCGCEDHEWAQLPVCWQKANAIAHDDLHALAAEYEANLAGGAAAALQQPGEKRHAPAKKKKRARKPDVSRHSRRGPRTIPVQYLLELMRPLKNVYEFEHFFPDYLHKYEEVNGTPPKNPRASFLQAADVCVEQVLLERGRSSLI